VPYHLTKFLLQWDNIEITVGKFLASKLMVLNTDRIFAKCRPYT
jgi:hypothetical protein